MPIAVVVFVAILGPAGIAMAELATLTIESPLNGTVSNNQTPSFSGATGDIFDEVTLDIYQGKTVSGPLVQTLGQFPLGETWSIGPVTTLPLDTYTARAVQTSMLTGTETSAPVTFTVNTASPTVTLDQPPSPSNNTKPSFTGSASDTTQVTVEIYAGATATGSPVSSATATGTGGGWTSSKASTTLSNGQYTAVATQPSSLGNPAGTSSPVTFTVDTAPPIVALNAPPSPSNNMSPSFTGSASDTTQVTVQIYKGTTVKGSPVSSATATGTGGDWTSVEASPTLESGRYTAIATQPSSLGNTAGKSEPVTFKVDTEAPTVTLNQPPSPSNDTTPSFTGTAEDTTPITVYIYAGATATGSPVSTATAEGTGERWSSGSASQALPNGQYTAKATQGSAGHEGTSSSVTFTVDTTPPLVALTFPSSGSTTSGGTQLVKGGAGTAPGDRSVVTIRLFAGSTIEAQQIPLETHLAEASNGGWSDNFGGLNPGTYTVQASQSDEAGNVGVSAATFTVGAPPFTPPTSPAASFRWFPSAPQTGEPVSLVSSSTDAASPITAFAWAPTSSSPFQAGGGVLTTSFSTPGGHVVRLRVTNAAGLSSVATETINVVGTRTPLMQPFPVVRIAGTEAASGVKLRLLAVQAPTGARITVKCRGRGCPVKSASRVARSGKVGVAPVEFRRFERTLRAGVILDVRVSKPGAIGKYTHFVVRRGKLPERLDMCLDPAGVAPLVCPSS